MWDCLKCKCKAIAASLGFCPQCFELKEEAVPKASLGGATNRFAAPGEPGYIAPEPVTAKAAKVPADAALDVDAGAKATAIVSAPEKPAEPPAKPETPAPAVVPAKPAATGPAPAAASAAPVTGPPAKGA